MPEAPVTTAAPVEVKAETPAPEAPATAPAEPKTYTQEDLDRITSKVKKNAAYRARKEAEAYFQGRLHQAAPAPKEPEKPKVDAAPNREDYADYEAFTEAKAAHVARTETAKALETREKEAKTREETEKTEKLFRDFHTKTVEKYPDIMERLDEIGDMEMPQGVGGEIAASEYGPDILNHFIQNPKECERITKLSPSAATKEILRLELRFESEAKKPASEASEATETPAVEATPKPNADKPRVSSAPAPITTVSAKGSAPSSVIKDGMAYEDFVKVRNKQLGRTH